ncbi:putative benzoate 4-monooxygenase cytochrome p450 protein [Botrytis fragariae]|uniref:Putative benzoate 4-monooxygenase cytochrome p450 protein n=1 Tax=Botrytis fragariae TaxID=1964551 RepID=A0A8H6ANS7_9HELO|nr:putative benzoate 4-monooxygenase cytochrome p450 protein [Botrytis fragariae]KAF5870852.1 putative benzoate 4-monooxygenase cytochrome p450 protein [Botrytis fragariae]
MAETFTTMMAAIACQVLLSPIHEPSTLKVISVYFLSNCVIFLYLTFTSTGIFQVIIHLFTLNITFLLTAIILTAFRRLYFSPLSHIPGPARFALTKLFIANEFRLGRTSYTIEALHKQYKSDVVRIGPNEVSIINADAVTEVFSGKYPRGTFYEIGAINGEVNLNTTRDYGKHTSWRRIWEKGFSSSAVKEYNTRVEIHVDKMIQILLKADRKEVNVSKAMDDLTFDIMADLSFSKHAGLQDGTGDNSYMSYVHKYMSFAVIIASLRNLAQLLTYMPETSDVRMFRERGERMLMERQEHGSTYRDIFSYLLSADPYGGEKFTQKELNSNANLIIIAGSDTTSSTLTQALRALAKEPRILSKLQREIDDLCSATGKYKEITIDSIRNLEYLNAVVDEVLRLYNPIPSGPHATTYPQGIEVGGVQIPGNVQVEMSHLVLMTDERYFPQGKSFIPERWTRERPELVRDRRAYIPFGYGVHSCVGKTLALHELRLVIARIVRTFDIQFGHSHDDVIFEREWKDYMAVEVGNLWIRFLARRLEDIAA